MINARHAIKKVPRSGEKSDSGFKETLTRCFAYSFLIGTKDEAITTALWNVNVPYNMSLIVICTRADILFPSNRTVTYLPTYLSTLQSNYGFPIAFDSSPLKLHPEATTFFLHFLKPIRHSLLLHFDFTRNTPKQVC